MNELPVGFVLDPGGPEVGPPKDIPPGYTLDPPTPVAEVPSEPEDAGLPQGFKLDTPQESPRIIDYAKQAGSMFMQGVGDTLASGIKGQGGRIAGDTEGKTFGRALELTQQGVGPAEAITQARGEPETQRIRPVSEEPVYRAGKAIEDVFHATFPDSKILNPVVSDVAKGFGSFGSNVAMGLTVPFMTPAALLSQGMGEAADTAIKNKATPEQQVTATRLGSIAGATDFVDVALPMLGSSGKLAGLIGKVGARILEGALLEGGQEGLQQFIQNLIAKGVYKPDQDVFEDVPYSALIGGIVGGGVKGAFGQRDEGSGRVPSAGEIDATLKGLLPPTGSTEVVQTASNLGQSPMPGPVFYSQLQRTAEDKLPSVASTDQILATLRNSPGVKQEEIAASGIEEWLASHNRPKLDKSEVLAFLEENQIQVQEVVHSWDTHASASGEAIPPDALPKYRDFVAPGDSWGYHEVLLTLPEKPSTDKGPEGWGTTAGGTQDNANFRGPHWKGTPNVLAHVRFTRREDAVGAPVLHIEEIQSDWHQRGRQVGYGGTQGELLSGVPDAPFKTSWPELALKRMLRWAADNGIQRVTLNNGNLATAHSAGIADRENNAKAVAGIHEFYNRILPSIMRQWAKRIGGRTGVTSINVENTPQLTPIENNGAWGIRTPTGKVFPIFDLNNPQVKFYGKSKEEVLGWITKFKAQDNQNVFYVDIPKNAVPFIQSGLPLFRLEGGPSVDVQADLAVPNKAIPMEAQKIAGAILTTARRFKVDAKLNIILTDKTIPQGLPGMVSRAQAWQHVDGKYTIVVDLKQVRNFADLYQLMSHELGHVVMWEHFKSASVDIKQNLVNEWEKFYETNKNQPTFQQFLDARDNAISLANISKRTLRAHYGQQLATMTPEERQYWAGFEEWFAEQTARWMTTAAEPLSVLDRFFASVASAVREFVRHMSNVLGLSFEPNATAKTWLESFRAEAPAVAQQTYAVMNERSRRANQSILDEDSEGKDTVAVETPLEVTNVMNNVMGALGQGPTPPGLPAVAAHASRMNRLYKYMAGLDQLVRSNPLFTPLLRYYERVVGMHTEESRIHDAATMLAKKWRWLGKRGEDLTRLIEAVVNLEHLPPGQGIQGVSRRPDNGAPNGPEMAALRRKYNIDDKTLELYTQIQNMFDVFSNLVAKNELERAKRRISDPVKLLARQTSIQAGLTHLTSVPYFPFMRFGEHFVIQTDAAGNTVHYETFEGPFPVKQQKKVEAALRAKLPPGHSVAAGKLPAADLPYLGQPTMLLDAMQDELGMVPSDQVLQMMQGQLASSMPFKRTFSGGRFSPGYSQDFMRAFSKFFFHGAKFYAKVKYAHDLNADVAAARALGARSNKASQIADYMHDHLKNNVLDTRGDFGWFKAGIFFWALGYVPAAATQNMSQTPMITFPYLSAKFGEIRATRAIIKAMADVSTFYRRGKYATMSEPDMRAIDYGIKRGTISETQAADLAGLAQGNNLLLSYAGNRVRRGWASFMEKAAWMFETAEQFNRRVAFRAALHLARENPTAKFVDQAVNQHEEEYKLLASNPMYGAAEARAIVAAIYATEDTQFVYARYGRPRAFRGNLAATTLVFKKYIQSTLFMLGNNPDVMWRFLLISMLLGGLGGIPGFKDFADILRALGIWLFGRDWNVERKTREFIINLFGPNPKLPSDMVLHGMARYGFGLPALLDLMGSNPSRGFSPQHSNNIPYPTFDRSKSITSDQILPFSVGKLFTPTKDVNKTIADEGQRASGAVFSVGFNIYKALMDQDSPASDKKRWEKAVPRALGDVSKAYRAMFEGRERSSKGGPATASTIVNYDPSDTEHMMEILGLLGGYQNLRTQAKWDSIMAKAETTAFYDLQRSNLLAQYHEAVRYKDPEMIKTVREAVTTFNRGLPDWARGKAISADTVLQSIGARERELVARESGVPVQRSNVGISRHIDTLFPEATVDVRRVR